MNNLNNALIGEGRNIDLNSLERSSIRGSSSDLNESTYKTNSITQNNYFQSNKMSPSEVARQTKRSMQDLAYGF